MRIFNLILVLIIFNANAVVLATGVNKAFNEREKYKNATILGNPDEAGKFLNKDADVSNFGKLDDASLMNQGQGALRSSKSGQLLQNSEERKIEAINRYKINPENSMLKNSLKVEQNPVAKTGGGALSATETSKITQIKKSCVEGVDFNIDVGLELVLAFEEKEEIIRKPETSITIPFKEVPDNWWQKSFYRYEDSACVIENVPHHTLKNNKDIHQQIKKAISARVGNLPPDAIFLPTQNIVADYNAPKNIIYPKSNNSFLPPMSVAYLGASVKFHYSAEERRKKFVEKDEYWRVATEGTEKLTESNECYETGRVCVKKGVKTFLGKYNVTRPCWYEKISYRCASKPKDGCAHLIKQNCRLADSECEYQVGSICLRWKRNFVCDEVKKEKNYSLANSPIYCLGGNCHTPSSGENQDFANVAYLAAINEAKKDCTRENNGICKNPITVFAGEVNGCDKAIIGFINCCSSMKGWGKDVNLSRCSPTEKGLALKRDKGLCHSVGTYCHKRESVTKTCLVKRTNFCCFASKLARIFHEQGRSQLNIDWGDGESPNCRPLTLDELVRLDYSKFDMEELFDALLSKGRSNMGKSFPSLMPSTLPELQKEHMKTTAGEKREIRRKTEQREAARVERERLAKLEAARVERERLAKLEVERLENQRLAKLEAARIEQERLAKIEVERLERQRLAILEAERQKKLERQRNVIRGQIANKERERAKLRERIREAEMHGRVFGTNGTRHLQNLLRERDMKQTILEQNLKNVK